MNTTIKRILAVFAGLATAMIVIGVTETFSGSLYPAPKGLDFHDKLALKQFTDSLPLAAFLIILAGYAVGSLLGGIVATLISGREKAGPALITGVVVMLGGVMNLLEIPHPAWFMVANLLVYVPFAYIGYVAVAKR